LASIISATTPLVTPVAMLVPLSTIMFGRFEFSAIRLLASVAASRLSLASVETSRVPGATRVNG
jgi:hypothetical protein